MDSQCSFDGCKRPEFASGLCVGHYKQSRKGRSLTPLRHKRQNGDPPQITCDERPCDNRFLEGPCHVFRGCKDPQGYGRISVRGRSVLVHRYVFQKEQGIILPRTTVLDHQCRNRACCNSEHLRPVTQAINATENVVNTIWQRRAAQTHCKYGHPFNEENTYRRGGGRHCRMCQKRYHQHLSKENVS